MADIGMSGMNAGGFREPPVAPSGMAITDVLLRIRHIEHEVQRLMLVNQALWELLRDKVSMADADLERKMHEVDMRDGIADGQITPTPLKCPQCGRISSSRHWKCLYCGLDFERPVTA